MRARKLLIGLILILGVSGSLFAQKQQLSILFFHSFVPANDEELVRLATEFGKERGVDVKVDFISIPEMYAKAAAEAEAQAGHDIIGAENFMVALYKDLVVTIDDVIKEIVDRWGPFHPIASEACYFDGHWKGLPWWAVPFHQIYRKDLFEQVGEELPISWSDLLKVGKKLKAIGHPVGFAISSCGDANNALSQVMWAFGAKIADEEGVVAIDSPETRNALEFVKQLYDESMPQEVLAWDNAGNNRFMLSGIGSWTLNPISIYVIGKRDFPELAENFRLGGPLRGEKGYFGSADFYSLMIWKFSPNVELAKDFLRYLYEEKNMHTYLERGEGFNLPAHPRFDAHPVFYENPILTPLTGYIKFTHLFGWPAPPDGRAQLAYTQWIIPTMFYKVVTGKATVDQAIKDAERALIEIGYKPRG